MSRKRKHQVISRNLGKGRHARKRMKQRHPDIDIKKLRYAIKSDDFEVMEKAPGRAFLCRAIIMEREIRFILKNPKNLITVLPFTQEATASP